MDPAALKYSPTHEWVHVDGSVATVGISDFAVKELTDLVHVELPKVGRQLKAGEIFGEVESVKAVSDLYAPVGGKVVAVNQAIVDDPAILSTDAYDKGWMIRLEGVDAAQLGSLLDRAAYEKGAASGH